MMYIVGSGLLVLAVVVYGLRQQDTGAKEVRNRADVKALRAAQVKKAMESDATMPEPAAKRGRSKDFGKR